MTFWDWANEHYVLGFTLAFFALFVLDAAVTNTVRLIDTLRAKR